MSTTRTDTSRARTWHTTIVADPAFSLTPLGLGNIEVIVITVCSI
jgi:hypothetical protein